MIKGTKYWNDKNHFWIQENNGIEAILKKSLPASPDGIHHGWLEDCGPTSAVNVLDSMGLPIGNSSIGGATLRPMDFLSLWMNTPANWPKLVTGSINPSLYMDNEIAQFYPSALWVVFGVVARYLEGQTFEWVSSLIQSGKGAMICLKTPGHFLGIVAFDDQTQELIYNDPWPGRTHTDGFNLRMKKEEWESNVKPYVILFS